MFWNICGGECTAYELRVLSNKYPSYRSPLWWKFRQLYASYVPRCVWKRVETSAYIAHYSSSQILTKNVNRWIILRGHKTYRRNIIENYKLLPKNSVFVDLNFCGLLYKIMKMGCSIPVASFLHTRTDRRTQQAHRRDATSAKRDGVYIIILCAAKSRNSSASLLGTSTFRD